MRAPDTGESHGLAKKGVAPQSQRGATRMGYAALVPRSHLVVKAMGGVSMKLGIFATTGAALHFGVSRLETIARIAWLPITLLLIFEMAFAFGAYSIVNNTVLTFSDVPRGLAFERVYAGAIGIVQAGVVNGDWSIIALAAVAILLHLILVASFLVPLIRLAGLGEVPRPGVVRLPFGPNQLRLIIALTFSLAAVVLIAIVPASMAAGFITGAIDDALGRTYANFPNENSLHTIDLLSAKDALTLRGDFWVFDFGLMSALVAGVAAVLFIILMQHFRQANRPAATRANPILRALFILATFVVVIGGPAFFQMLSVSSGEFVPRTFADNVYGGLFLLFVLYMSVRFLAYPGIAVCRNSLSMSGVLSVSRGWNLFRMGGIFILLALLLTLVQWLIDSFAFPLIATTVMTLFTASESVSLIFNDGEAAAWIFPLFSWIWTGIKIVYKFVWLFFTYGVWAGFLGQLYRLSDEGGAARPD